MFWLHIDHLRWSRHRQGQQARKHATISWVHLVPPHNEIAAYAVHFGQTGATPGRLIRNPSTAAKRASGETFNANLQKIRSLREHGRGLFDVQAGVDRSNFIAHMPGPISQAFYRAERKQQAFEAVAEGATSSSISRL